MASPQTRAKVCPGCGVLLDPSDTTCFQCGAIVSNITAPRMRLAIKRNFELQGELTLGVILLNFLLFALTWVFSGVGANLLGNINNDVLNSFGAKNSQLIAEGQFWRLVTACFLHANMLHIIMNMLALKSLGQVVEDQYGWKKYAFFYVGSGILGNLVSALFNPEALSIGASGAIMGMAGVLLANSVRHWKSGGSAQARGLLRWLFYVFLIGFLLSGYIDNANHVGGLLGGFLLALPFSEHPPYSFWGRVMERVLGFGSLFVLCLSFAAMVMSR